MFMNALSRLSKIILNCFYSFLIVLCCAPIMMKPTHAGYSSATASAWGITPTRNATLSISKEQTPIVNASYVFWGEKWKWANTTSELTSFKNKKGDFFGNIPALDLKFQGHVNATKTNQLKYSWEFDASQTHNNIIGGGIEFNLSMDNPVFKTKPDNLILLKNHLGWKWQISPNEVIEVEFSRPIHNISFERGKKNKIRAMFIGDSLLEGKQQLSMTVTLPVSAQVSIPLFERYGQEDNSNWFKNALDPNESPVDLSFLNHKPAGRHGFVKTKGDQLIFEDGTPVRFWGGNIAAYAIFSDKKQIELQAKRMAKLGFNLMRIHHHDSMQWVKRTVIDQTKNDSQHLDKEVMDRLDYWIKCLRDEGIYVWLDLHVSRLFKPGDDIGEGFQEMVAHTKKSKNAAEARGYNYYNAPVEQLMKEFNAKYLNHVNLYTGLAYKDDPAIMGLLITNENDLTNHFGNLMLPNKNNPYHNNLFTQSVRDFSLDKNINFNQTLRTWEAGPSKLFLADWEHQWNTRMLAHLKKLDVKIPIATTQMWGNMKLHGLPSLTAGNIIDVHSYGKSEALSTNLRYSDNYISYMTTGQVYNKPTSITEWNVPYPEVDRFTAPLYIASIASLQEWDAVMIYNYSQTQFSSYINTWSTYLDPSITAIMPAAALLYRSQHVKKANRSYCLKLNKDNLYYRDSHPNNMATLRTLVEKSKVSLCLPDVPELEWDKEASPDKNTIIISDINEDFIQTGQYAITSDTAELKRNWLDGIQTINTPLTQAAQGWIGGKIIRLKDVNVIVRTPSKATIAISSLDGQPIKESKKLLITLIARATPLSGRKLPFLSEPIKGQIRIKNIASGLKLVPLNAQGEKLEGITPKWINHQYYLDFPQVEGTHWFLLTM